MPTKSFRIFITLLLFAFSLPAYAAPPYWSILYGNHSVDNIGRINTNSQQALTQWFAQRGASPYVYGGGPLNFTGRSAQDITSQIRGFLQQSATPSNTIWWAGHGTLTQGGGGWDNTPLSRSQMLQTVRQTANELGKDVVFIDHSCGSGECASERLTGVPIGRDHLKAVITNTGVGQLGYTGTLEQLFSDAAKFDRTIDTNGDLAVSVGEMKAYSERQGWPYNFAGDMEHKLMYHKDADPKKHPELAENVCVVLGPALDGPGVDDALAEEMSLVFNYNATVAEQKAEARAQQKSDANIYFYVPDATNIRAFLGRLKAGNKPTFDINSLQIPAGPYGIGKTVVFDNAQSRSAYFKVVGGDQCTAESVKFEAADPTSLQGGNGLFGGGGLGGGLGSNALLPLLMQGLFGQGLGGFGGQGGYGQNPYGGQYGQQQYQDCSRMGDSPVCGIDGRTYRNTCYIRQANVALQRQGVCEQVVSPSPSPSVTPNTPSIINQIAQSGIPNNLLESVRNTVSSVLSSVLAGGVIISETIVR